LPILENHVPQICANCHFRWPNLGQSIGGHKLIVGCFRELGIRGSSPCIPLLGSIIHGLRFIITCDFVPTLVAQLKKRLEIQSSFEHLKVS